MAAYETLNSCTVYASLYDLHASHSHICTFFYFFWFFTYCLYYFTMYDMRLFDGKLQPLIIIKESLTRKHVQTGAYYATYVQARHIPF